MTPEDPQERLAASTREFGEWGGVNVSTETSTTFTVLKADTLPQIFSGRLDPTHGGCYLYGRSLNPTVRYLGRQLAALEGAQAGYCCASGMAAISAALLALCGTGDHIVASNAVYGGTFALLKEFLPAKCGISVTFVPMADLDAVAAAITDRTKVIYTETLSNPTLVVADIPSLASLARSKGIKLVVDNTFTPMILSPIRLGADVVVHSLTKFISGASDIIAGAVCAKDGDFINRLLDLHLGPLMLLGPTMDPKVASELSLRLPHLALRLKEHSARAQTYAERLQALGARVCYPGLPSHPQHELLKRLANPGYGAGGVLTVDMVSQARAQAFMERLQNKHSFGLMAVSLGYFDTLMSASAASTSSELSESELEAAGISGGLVRMSVGLTGSVAQRWAQLEEAWSHFARFPLTQRPSFKAAQVTRDQATGQLKRTPSWHSFGGEVEEEGGAGEGGEVSNSDQSTVSLPAVPAAEPAAAKRGPDASPEAAAAPAVKVRRISTGTEVIYTRMPVEQALPAVAAAAAGASAAPATAAVSPP